jgi:hypothetical protein
MTEHVGGASEEKGRFGELLKYTLSGYAVGLALGALLDYFGFQRSPVGQWLVRTLSGEGESIFEGFYAIRRRLSQASSSLAEAYAWGKLLGMSAPWIIDWGSRFLGVDVYGVEGFYIPYFYALSDQIGANTSGLIFFHRREESWRKTISKYIHNAVMVTSLAIILIVPIGLLLARLSGFSPTTQIYTAFETIAANLCWVPPLVGWLKEKSRGEGGDDAA